tara:strand:- start:2222 stop:3328 length:1107 start_codon:yes stop_codon:yes gene_type:complete
VVVIIITISTGLGLKKTITQNLINTQSNIQITNLNKNNETKYISVNKKKLSQIKEIHGVKAIHPIILKSVILKKNNLIEGVILKGINQDYKKKFIEQNIVSGTYFVENKTNQILISYQQSKKLNLHPGDHCLLYFLSKNKNIQKRKFNIVGIYDLKNEEFNKNFCLVQQSELQKINKWKDNHFTKFEVEIDENNYGEKIAKEINKILEYNLIAQTLNEKFSKLFQWIKLFDKNIAFILIIMTLICILNMTNTLLILIVDRIKMIGTLKSIGFTNYSIIKIFLYNSMSIAIKSIIIGNLIALIICFIQMKTNLIVLDPKSYFINYLPMTIDIKWIIIINTITFILIQFSIIVPYFVINRLSPAKILKVE